MKRRNLIKSLAAGTIGAPLVNTSVFEECVFDDLSPRKNLLMRVGGDNHTVSQGWHNDLRLVKYMDRDKTSHQT